MDVARYAGGRSGDRIDWIARKGSPDGTIATAKFVGCFQPTRISALPMSVFFVVSSRGNTLEYPQYKCS